MFFDNNIHQIQQRMNDAGRGGSPFLFGVNYELNEGFFVDNPLLQDQILFSIHGTGNKEKSPKYTDEVLFSSNPISPKAYRSKFDIIHAGLRRGDSFLSNLTIRTPIETNVDFQDIFRLSDAPYSLCVPHRFVCFSPERFVHIDSSGVISSNPMKGTIDANAADAANSILNDFKETAEHNTIVDLIRNDLSIIATDVRVDRFRYIDVIKTKDKEILQVSSEIKGQLANDYLCRLGDIIFGMLPAGSISGAPKDATVSLIRKAEGQERGYYTGVFGYFDGQTFDSGVMIRFIENEDGNLYYRSGGGITAYSNWEDEYKEVLSKIYLPFVR